jgi:hypothetical protein
LWGLVFYATKVVKEDVHVEIKARFSPRADRARAADTRHWRGPLFAVGQPPARQAAQVAAAVPAAAAAAAVFRRGLFGLQAVNQLGQAAHLLLQAEQAGLRERLLGLLALPRAYRGQAVLKLAHLALVLAVLQRAAR